MEYISICELTIIHLPTRRNHSVFVFFCEKNGSLIKSPGFQIKLPGFCLRYRIFFQLSKSEQKIYWSTVIVISLFFRDTRKGSNSKQFYFRINMATLYGIQKKRCNSEAFQILFVTAYLISKPPQKNSETNQKEIIFFLFFLFSRHTLCYFSNFKLIICIMQ